MKYLSLVIVSISCFIFCSCNKGDSYYYDYQKSEQLYEGTIYSYLMGQRGTYDSLAVVLERLPDLKSVLNQSDSSVTFFAMNNRSFKLALENLNNARKVNGRSPIYLEDIDLAVLDTLSYRYLFNSEHPVSDFESYLDGQSIYSSKFNYEMHVVYKVLTSSGLVGGGQQQLMFSDTNGSIYQRYWNSTNTSTVDFMTRNGVIHTLDARHEFGFGKLLTYLSNN
ncbi:fasciclin domain-containing protein [Sphingobacterium hungaricum]|uniref:Fasciclin domain-containing protein n=1 Tax=Sphingobacterium hungaricum TaxID=2082723 RepID=A0A928YQY2_9SPHI|nr:hypothetical protein [Sphingobacterium hungaricum]MBE8712798.1 hypothetical protein [Sphingobacterium hungaricum]